MGRETTKSSYEVQDFTTFEERLRQETDLLKQWFQQTDHPHLPKCLGLGIGILAGGCGFFTLTHQRPISQSSE